MYKKTLVGKHVLEGADDMQSADSLSLSPGVVLLFAGGYGHNGVLEAGHEVGVLGFAEGGYADFVHDGGRQNRQ